MTTTFLVYKNNKSKYKTIINFLVYIGYIYTYTSICLYLIYFVCADVYVFVFVCMFVCVLYECSMYI